MCIGIYTLYVHYLLQRCIHPGSNPECVITVITVVVLLVKNSSKVNLQVDNNKHNIRNILN